MKTFTISRAYYALVTNKVEVNAETPEEAMRLAMQSQDWNCVETYHEGAHEFIVDIWEGPAWETERLDVAIPDELREPTEKLQDIIDDLRKLVTAQTAAAPAHPVAVEQTAPDPDPFVHYVLDGMHGTGLWSDLVQANDEWDDEEAARILAHMRTNRVYHGGGGAQPTYSLRLMLPGEED